VVRTLAYRDPLAVPDQCIYGHLWKTSDDYQILKNQLPRCKTCLQRIKETYNQKLKKRLVADPEFAAEYKAKVSARNQEWKQKNPDRHKANIDSFTASQLERRTSDPDYRAEHNARSAKWSKDNRDKRNEAQRTYRERVPADPNKVREYGKTSYAKIKADPEQLAARREKAREAQRKRMQDPEYRDKVNAQRRARRAAQRDKSD